MEPVAGVRVRRWLPLPEDALLAAAFAAASVTQVVLDPIAGPVTSGFVALASTAPLAWRRRFPSVAALAGSAVWLVPTDGYLYLGFTVAAVLYFSVGSRSAPRRVVAVTATGMVLFVVAVLLSPQHPGVTAAAVLAVAGPAAVGRLVAHQRAQNARLRELTEELVRERSAAQHAAVAEERARIARELHDVVGHEVTVIALQADAAAAALAGAPERAAAPVAAIRGAAAQALDEMRRLVALLRVPGDGDTLHPQPGLGDLPALVDAARSTGTRVDATLRLPAVPPPPGVQLTAYRVVQESLTNAHRHAPGASVVVRVEDGGDQLCVEVVDTGGPPARAPGAGNGVIGMRERVRMHGGELDAGPTADGFAVRARLPVSRRASS